MRVYLGADHAGYELKQAIIEPLEKGGHEPIDCGAVDYDAEDDYPAFCIAAALRTFANPGSLGILIAGMTSIAPDRRKDIVQLGFRAFAGGTLACFMSACVAGVLIYA